MIKLALVIFLILYTIHCTGMFICEKFNLKDDFQIPIGFVFYLFILQLSYYPIQFYQLSSKWIMLFSSLITLFFVGYGVKNWKKSFKALLKKEYLWIVVSTAVFCFVFYRISIAMDFSDSSVYLNYIAQNIDIDHLNCFDFWTGKYQQPNEVFYIYQGYYHFGSFLCWLTNILTNLFHVTGYVSNLVICAWGLGILYSVVSSVFALEIVHHFKIPNKLLRNSLIIFLLFYFNYYYWRVGYAFYGNTFRTLFVGMMIYYLFRKFSCKEEISTWVFSAILGAGLASSSSFLFIVFDVIYVLMAYYYVVLKESSFKTLSVLVFPMVLYTIGVVGYYSMILAHIILLVVVAYYYGMNSFLNKWIQYADNFLLKFGKILLLVLVPLGLIVFSWILCRNPYYLSNYAHYLENHAEYDMVIDPFGRFDNNFERIFMLIQWFGLILVCWHNIKKKKYFIPFLLLGCLLIFLNPLTTPAIAKLYADFVYYRAFDILFNQFTLVIYVLAIANCVKKNTVINLALCAAMLILTIGMHTPILIGEDGYSSYYYLNKLASSENSLFKIEKEDYTVMTLLMESVLMESDEQLTVISHAQGLKTFFPNVYQIFSRRQIFDVSSRVNEEFYQLSRNHYSWEEKQDENYSKSCDYIKEYDVDIAIIQYKNNFEFDIATDACMVTVIKTESYHIKKIMDYEN